MEATWDPTVPRMGTLLNPSPRTTYFTVQKSERYRSSDRFTSRQLRATFGYILVSDLLLSDRKISSIIQILSVGRINPYFLGSLHFNLLFCLYGIIITMIYISDKQQERIKRKIKGLPNFFKKEEISIIFFELIGVLILTYGWCVGRYQHPIDQHKVNISFEFLISCFYYFALSVAAPFSGGHLNPSVTVARSILRINNNKKYYIIAQMLGALLGSGIAYIFFEVNPFFYWHTVDFGTLVLDCIGQAFGSFIFIFFILLITETNYMTGQYFRYLLMSTFFLAGRIFTLRRSCLNPAVAIAMQLFATIQKGDVLLLIYSIGLIVGEIAGAVLASYFFHYFYAPLKQGIAFQHIRMSHIDEQDPYQPEQQYK